eukprot:Blabericola_migrator_1__3527@NODE_2046_length_3372_cov_29_044478_g1298_i0_p2_GENE_NODE_2046_length_3372_cov_29_044478_g1298_i0NODE_2046_length_3372_cov_29_044478_g1298_i0_p2_ORF_typecomplete_len252_score48_65zfMYND/PF01753_18/1_8e04zfMYND/PF01753_18/7_9e11DUF3846/PF12957_7/0_0039DUF2202/PF09968_9/0_029COMPASSShg1/PF05205_12/0_11DUF1340/PF07067_11/0_12HBS1_N/PF08938_10/3_4HBS1_N/PF08938_10/59Rhodanese_C/PF12368_8/5_1e03Rhodanese_C/PF12368_8/0_39zfC6H2/PF15801_5/4_2_NODE_2046_length_3372_cov_29_04
MEDSITSICHPKFKYVYIPQDISDPVEVREFEGKEGEFQELLKSHFSSKQLSSKEKEALNAGLKEEVQKQLQKNPVDEDKANQVTPEVYDSLADMSVNRYQIIPLTLPTQKTQWEAVNAYIDNVGRIKGLPTNVRATRITQDDICGDCFLSKTYDDNEAFKRIDFEMSEYEEFLQNPPSTKGRWSPEQALAMAQSTQPSKAEGRISHCQNCFKERSLGVKLSLCGRCRKVAYCCAECQKADWQYHKRLCMA